MLHEAGLKVVIGYLGDNHIVDALKLFPENDPRLHAIRHDVMDRDAWERTADEIEKKFGGVHVLVNNAGVGLQAPASTGTLKDWEWGLGVNLWGPIYGVHTFVPRMLASKQGAHIVTTTSTSGILPGGGAGIYAVAKIAAVGLMEELRHELRNTHIGTSAFIPGLTATNIGQSESYRPESLKNDGPPAVAPGASSRPAPGAGGPRPPRLAKCCRAPRAIHSCSGVNRTGPSGFVSFGRRSVPGAGIEPARGHPRGIFVPTTAFTAAHRCAFGVWTLSLPCRALLAAVDDLGRGRQVSTLSRYRA